MSTLQAMSPFDGSPKLQGLGPAVQSAEATQSFMANSYHVFNNPAMPRILPPGGVLVPQKTYTPERPTPPFERMNPIRFEQAGIPGIYLANAINNDTFSMPGAEDRVDMPNAGQKIGIRIVWPGYTPWSKYIVITEPTGGLVTKARLAQDIAKTVRQCLQELEVPGISSTEPSRDWWAAEVPIDQLVLLELHHVLQASWQPVLCRVVPQA